MAQKILSLQPSEMALLQAASNIFAAYVMAGRVPEGREEQWIETCVCHAYQVAKCVDDHVRADNEMG